MPACADDLSALYSATWAGVPAAEIRLILHEGGGSYRDEIGIGSEGLSRLVTRFRGTAVSQGRVLGQRLAGACSATVSTTICAIARTANCAWTLSPANGATVAERGPGDTSRKPELAEEFRRNVLDPLSVISLICAKLQRGETQFTIPVYDGARRFSTLKFACCRTILPTRAFT